MREKKLTFFIDIFLTGGIFCKATITLYPGKRRNTIILFSRRFDILFLGEQIFERCCNLERDMV
ncbi:hypothetical protein D3Z62_01615 [Lachnospiraceae bacterium]|nr:hypothetical protein [Lachnospiraceae bacterium]